MSEKPKISFIVPVYKVEKYLNQCVDSLLCQTFKDFEVILVDDGSPDGSPAICDSYAEKDERVRVLHKENGGLSDARNVGIMMAKGEYIIFVDSDDFWINEHCLEDIVNSENFDEFDMLGFNGSYYFPNNDTYSAFSPYSERIASPL